MDRFDKLSTLAVIALLISAAALMGSRPDDERPDPGRRQEAAAAQHPADAAELEKAGRRIRQLMDAENIARAEALITELTGKYPYQGEPYMLKGDLLMRKQEPIRAMYAYREAIDLNPDYLDKKTPLFQGKKLKVAVGEALAEIESRLKQNTGDAALKGEKKYIYYLYRRIAGSCG